MPGLLVLVRMNRGAGRKDWFLVRSLGDLDTTLIRSSTSDCLTVFAGRHLPYRGRADDALLERALTLVGSVDESVFGEVVDNDPELVDSFAAVPTDGEWVREWFTERWGRPVAFGEYPPFLSDDPTIAIDGIVPKPDGTVERGIY